MSFFFEGLAKYRNSYSHGGVVLFDALNGIIVCKDSRFVLIGFMKPYWIRQNINDRIVVAYTPSLFREPTLMLCGKMRW